MLTDTSTVNTSRLQNCISMCSINKLQVSLAKSYFTSPPVYLTSVCVIDYSLIIPGPRSFRDCFFLQVVDTPGILDHSLEDRNTIEMQVWLYCFY